MDLTRVVCNKRIVLASLDLKIRLMIPKMLLALCIIRLIWDLNFKWLLKVMPKSFSLLSVEIGYAIPFE